jgi:type IV secretion system protein VirB10
MRFLTPFLLTAFTATLAQIGQSPAAAPAPAAALAPEAVQMSPAVAVPQASAAKQITVPVGTEVLLQLKSVIDTKSSKVGDGVYCQTTFPVVADNTVVIPAGAYVKGEISRLQRAGRIHGRAEVLFHFTTIIFPNGYTVELPGTLHGDAGTSKAKVADDEGTVRSDGHDKLKKLPESVGKGATYGTVGGVIASGNLTGLRVGGGIGAAIGLASVLATRGPDVRIEPGATLAMVLQRPLIMDVNSGAVPGEAGVSPHPAGSNRLPVPSTNQIPK